MLHQTTCDTDGVVDKGVNCESTSPVGNRRENSEREGKKDSTREKILVCVKMLRQRKGLNSDGEIDIQR